MNTITPPKPKRGLGITLRTTLLPWLITLVTLGTFIAFLLAQQQRTLLENLESRAQSIALSLRDLTADMMVQEDPAGVISIGQGILKADETLDYLIFTKRGGPSLIQDRSGWRSENLTSPEWQPNPGDARSGIGFVPLFQRRVYRHSTAGESSGISWGWIHVGLSPDRYDRALASVYRRTGGLAILCATLSFLASMVYAQRIVRPILQLREQEEKDARGDRSARDSSEPGDPPGSPAPPSH